MSVSIYELNCKYQKLNLKKEVYLIPETHLKRIHIDNGAAYIDGLNTAPTRISVEEVALSEETSLDERFRFSKTLTFKVRGRKDLGFLDEKYYAIIVTADGVKYCVNVEFPSTVTYTYTLSQDTDETSFTLSTVSNHPTLRLATDIPSANDCKGYFMSCVRGIRLLEKHKSALREGYGVTSSEAFKKVDYIKESIIFTESFDGSRVITSLSFDIPLSEYKSSWAYELLEFIYNTYSLILEACNGFHYAGFNFGLEPSFTVNGDGDNAMISIALTEMSDRGGLFYVNPLPEDINGTITYVYTDEHDGFVCTQSGLAQYLLQKEINFLGNPTGRYKVLAGYEDMFPDLNIVGTFSDAVYFQTDKCGDGGGGGMTGGTLPDVIDLQSGECKSFTFSAVCDWNVSDSSSDLTITPTSGVANRLYTITVCRDVESPTCDVTLSNYEPIICLHEGYLEGGRKVYSGATTITGVSSCGMYGSHGASAWEDGFSSQSTGIEDHSPNMAVPITIVHVIGYDNEDYDSYLSRDHEGSFYIKDADGNVIYTITATIRYCGGNNPGGGTWDDE